MDKDVQRVTLRINQDILDKFDYVSEYNARSRNSEILILLRGHVAQFEKEHGPIELEDKFNPPPAAESD